VEALVKITPERFDKGLTLSEFVRGMGTNRDLFEQNYDSFTLRPEDVDFLRSLDRRLHVLVLAEDWCGDVLRYVPAFAKMCEVTDKWDVRVFYRDRNPDLAEMWLKEGKYRSIPVMVFFDEDWNEVACYVEKPAAVYRADEHARAAFLSQHPHLPDADLPPSEMTENTYSLYTQFVREFRNENKKRWQQMFADEIRQKLSKL
jgi:thiol-disulfide isomerase/thioredoxin